MTRKLDLKVDQSVVIRYINDRIRYERDKSIDNIDEWTCEGIVTKVGRKYIQVNMKGWTEKFDIEFDYEQATNVGSSDYKIYLSKEEIVNEVKSEALYSVLRNYFSGWRNKGALSLDQLNRIKDIVEE